MHLWANSEQSMLQAHDFSDSHTNKRNLWPPNNEGEQQECQLIHKCHERVAEIHDVIYQPSLDFVHLVWIARQHVRTGW